MTSPNQPAPDGAVTIGGGAFRFGKHANEKQSRETFELQTPGNLIEAIQMLPSVLSMLPNDSMKPWQRWFNLTDDEFAEGDVRQRIVDSLSKRPLKRLLDNLWDGFKGTAGSEDKTPEDVLAAAQEIAINVNTALTNSGQATSNAESAQNAAYEILASGSNLIANYDFENGFSGQPLQGVFSDDVAYSGDRSLKMTSNGSGKSYDLLSGGLTPRKLPASEGDVFLLDVYVYGAESNIQTSGAPTGVRLAVTPYNRFGVELADAFVSLPADASTRGVWTKMTAFVTMPTGTSTVKLSLQLTGSVSDGEVYYFDLSTVREVTLAKQASDAADSAQASADAADASAQVALLNAQDANDLAGMVLESGSNLIANPDFEKGLFSPQPLVGEYSTAQKYSGTRSLRMQATGSLKTFYLLSDGLTPRTITSKAGDVYYCEMYVYGSGITQSVTGGLRLVFESFNRLGAQLADTYVSQNVSTSMNNTWTKVSAYVTLPTDTAKFKVGVQLRNTVTAGYFYIDQVIVREVTLAKTAETAASSAQATANIGVSNAAAAQTAADTADGKAVTAQSAAATADSKAVTADGKAVSATAAANAASTAAGAADTKAVTADGKAVAAQSAAATADGKAVNAQTNLQTTIDGIVQAVDGGTATGAAATAPKTKFQLLMARLFDGMYGNASGTNTSKISSDLFTAGTALRSATTTAQTTATNANNAAATADGKAVTAQNNLQTVVDGVVQAVDGGSATGAAPSAAKTKLQLAWASLWDGLRGTSGATAKTPADVRTEAAALKSKADSTETSLGAANTNHGTLVDNVTKSFMGDDSLSGSSLANALAAMKKTYEDLAANTKAIQSLQSKRDLAAAKGATYAVDFSDFASMTAAGFTVTYSGSGTSTIGISGGVAQWTVNDSLSRDAKIIHGSATNSDFQAVRGVMSAPPQVPNGTTPYFYAIARVSPDGLNYVWARAYAQSFGVYKADIGYCVGGVETTWASNVPLTWSLDMRFVAGIGTDARQYQIWSGNKVVYSYNESGTSSRLCSNAAHTAPSMHDTSCTKYRLWGAIAQVRNGKVAGKVSSATATDNGTPAVNGSCARLVRTSTSNVSFVANNAVTGLSSFWDSAPYESPDVDANTSGGWFRVTDAKPYLISARVRLSGNAPALAYLILQKSTDGSSWTDVQWGPPVVTDDGQALFANWVQYLNEDEYVRVAYTRNGTINLNVLNGESTGAQSYFTIASAEAGV